MTATIIALPARPANDDQLDLHSLIQLGDRLLDEVLDVALLDGFLGLLNQWEAGHPLLTR